MGLGLSKTQTGPLSHPKRMSSMVDQAARPSFGALLRRIAGVDETLLAIVPTERFRYTRLGGVIVGTASIAALSMYLGFSEIFGHATLLLAGPALLWGLFIGNLDAWIVSSLHGTRWRRHAWVVLPRFALALLFGFLIAEPLVLRAFAPAIEREIHDTRQTELLTFQSHLRECNPTTGVVGRLSANCGTALVVVNVPSPDTLTEELANLHAQERSLNHSISSNNAQQLHLEELARLECNGSHGAGLSGIIGVGPNCKRNREEANRFAAVSRTSEQTAQLDSVSKEIQVLTGERHASAQVYQQAVDAAVAAKVSEFKSHQGSIGLLERLYALRSLVAKSWYLAVAEWFLRLLFVTIDCLPVIVKISGGSTTYDRLLDAHLSTDERSFSASERTREKRATSKHEIDQYQTARKIQDEKEAIDSRLRLDSARRNLEVDAAIDEFTERLLREQRSDHSDVSARERFHQQMRNAVARGAVHISAETTEQASESPR
jgi:Domain of unknown function (DUF4407)